MPGEHIRLGRRLLGIDSNKRGGHNEAFRVSGAATASRPSVVHLSMHVCEPLVSCEKCEVSSMASRKIFRVSLLRTDELEKLCVSIGAIFDLTSPLRSVAILDASIPDTHLSILGACPVNRFLAQCLLQDPSNVSRGVRASPR